MAGDNTGSRQLLVNATRPGRTYRARMNENSSKLPAKTAKENRISRGRRDTRRYPFVQPKWAQHRPFVEEAPTLGYQAYIPRIAWRRRLSYLSDAATLTFTGLRWAVTLLLTYSRSAG